MVDYYSHLFEYTYDEYVALLSKKYGPVPRDYFANSNCKSKPPINSRSKDGLEIHHIDENKIARLYDENIARNNSFDYQKSHRLVYCNYLEHLVLHILIYTDALLDNEEMSGNASNMKDPQIGIRGAIQYMIPRLNRLYCSSTLTLPYEINAFNVIMDNYEDHIKIVKFVFAILLENDKSINQSELINHITSGLYGKEDYRPLPKIRKDAFPSLKYIQDTNSNDIEKIKTEFCEDFGCSACLRGECSAKSVACEAYLATISL